MSVTILESGDMRLLGLGPQRDIQNSKLSEKAIQFL